MRAALARGSALKMVCAWTVILGVGLAGLELYARLTRVRPFPEHDKLRVYNRRFYELRRERFAGWVPQESFDSAEPVPQYLFKPGLRMARRDGRLEPAGPGEKPFWVSNSWGFRGAEFELRKPKGALRIVCLGASTTEGTQSDEETYPYYLQKELRGRKVEVINAGHSGMNMDDLHALLKLRVLPLKPDLVIVYEAANNVALVEFTGGPGWLKPLLKRSALFSIFEERFGLGRMPHSFDDKGPKPGVQRYGDALRRVVADARKAGARVVLSSFIVVPHEGLEASLKRDAPLWRDIHRHYYPLSMAELERVFDAYNAESRAVAAELKVPYADVAAGFPKEARYFPYDIMHLSPEGNKILAGLFARFLEKKVL